MADWLYNHNHNIRVITAPHFYPEWKKNKRKLYYDKERIPYTTWRCPIYVPKHPTGIKRALHSLSFIISSIPILFRNLLWKPDFIISVEPPLFTAPFTIIYSFLTRSKSILHIQDLEIDAAISLNIIKSGILYKPLKISEKFLLNKYDVITTISPKMIKKIIEKGINGNHIHLLPNWANIENIKPTIKNDYLRKRLNIPNNKKIVLYSGNIGEKQNLDIIINVAIKLQNKMTNCLFLLVGDGVAKPRLQQYIVQEKITNIKFLPLVKFEDLGALLTMAEIHLVTQDKNISDLVLPSKLTNILSSGGVSIISAKTDTQLAQLVDEYNIGLLINPDSEDELTIAITELLSNTVLKQQISTNARNYAVEFLSKQSILEKFEANVLKN